MRKLDKKGLQSHLEYYTMRAAVCEVSLRFRRERGRKWRHEQHPIISFKTVMKKTLITAALLMTATMAMAGSAYFEGVSEITSSQTVGDITFTPVSGADYAYVEGATSRPSGHSRTSSVIVFSINYDAIFNADNTLRTNEDGTNAVAAQNLIVVSSSIDDIRGGAVGLAYDGNGNLIFTAPSNGTAWTATPSAWQSNTYSLTESAVHDSLYTALDGNRWLTLGFIPSTESGTALYNKEGEVIKHVSGLRSTDGHDKIFVNTSGLVKNISFDSNFSNTLEDNREAVLEGAKRVPEPTAAMLSLLSLAGLAARRRRRK